jgi:putative hemin transport protein
MHNTDSLRHGRFHAPLTGAQRLAVGIPHRVTRLTGPFSALLHRIDRLGSVTILTGNASVIQERVGVYDHAACRSGGPADRLLIQQKWKYGFAVTDSDADGNIHRRLQFFDADGNGLHKILLHEAGCVDAFHAIVHDFVAPEQAPVLDIFRTAPVMPAEGVARLDINALRADWARLDHAGDFFMRQVEFDRLRLHKLRLAGKAFAHQVAKDSVRILLQKMADLGSSVMAQVGNAGLVQAYQGRIRQIRSIDAWLNIMNQDYRLRLREGHIDTVWVAKKPTADGIITSLELFNRQGLGIARFFSEPEPGRPEPREWRDSIMRLLPVFGA